MRIFVKFLDVEYAERLSPFKYETPKRRENSRFWASSDYTHHPTDTEFFRCDIQKADFRNATGYKIDVITCNIAKAGFSVPEVYNLLDSLDIKIE